VTDTSEPDSERAILVAWGSVLRRYRIWKRLSRRDLARRAGLSAVYLGEIERGEKDPSSHSLSAISAGLGVPLAELYLRVATRLDTKGEEDTDAQPALPLAAREGAGGYLDGVSLAKDETAFDLYRVVRGLRTDQQLAFLMLARSLPSKED
jgi:transcriptional regulator with XRE-family HTH domain